MNTKRFRTSTIVYRITAVMICLVLFSSWLMSGLLARYITSDEASDSARVAAFINPEEDVTFDVTVESITPSNSVIIVPVVIDNSKGETAITVKLEKTVIGELPDSTISYSVDVIDTEIDVNAKTKTNANIYIKFNFNENLDNNFIYSNQIGYVTITVTCVQID